MNGPRAGGAPQGVSVYVHWPYCSRICPYCDFNVVRDRGREIEAEALHAAILRDLRTQAERLGPRRLTSIFFGGGTPSLMTPAQAAAVIEAAAAMFDPVPVPGLEITLEANPTDAEAARFAGLAAAGINRLSLGVQSLDARALAFLGRNHDPDQARRAAELARRHFPRLSLDLIYALPDQREEAWARELEAALELGAEHISPYQLTIEPGTAFGRDRERGRLTPSGPERSAALYEITQSVLSRAGFDAYEVSNHARGEAARCRHNLAIWRGGDYLGAGPGAHGRVTVDGVRIATFAAPRIHDYIGLVEQSGWGSETREVLTAVEVAEERVLMGLRLDEGVPWAALTACGIEAGAAKVATLAEAGLVRQAPEALRVTAEGRLVLDRLTRELIVG